jgi:hypothetical protein
VAAVLLPAALPVSANMVVTVKCTAGDASAVQEFQVVCNAGVADWALAGPVDLLVGDVKVAKITDLSVQTNSEPFVNLRFAVEAGAADTTFDITSTVVSFAPLANPQAYASGGVALSADGDGATVTGLFGGRSYQARYNGSTVYANLVPGFAIPADQTVVNADRTPAGGYGTITGSVSSIESEFNFTLSAFDQASGTSRFEVVPEPATISVLCLGGLALLARKRHRP